MTVSNSALFDPSKRTIKGFFFPYTQPKTPYPPASASSLPPASRTPLSDPGVSRPKSPVTTHSRAETLSAPETIRPASASLTAASEPNPVSTSQGAPGRQRPRPTPNSTAGGARPPSSPPTLSRIPPSSVPCSTSSSQRRATVRSSQSADEEEILGGVDDARPDDDVNQGYASEDSLDALDTINRPSKRRKLSPELQSATGKSARNVHGSGVGAWARCAKPKALPKYNFSLDRLVQSVQKESQIQADFKRHMAAIEAGMNDPENDTTLNNDAPEGDRVDGMLKTLGTALSDDDDDAAERVQRAIRRTQAGRAVASWRFFSSSQPKEDNLVGLDVPDELISNSAGKPDLFQYPQLEHLVIESTREYSLLTGLARDLLTSGDKPDALVEWFSKCAVAEPRDDLRQAHIDALVACGSQAAAFFPASEIHNMFKEIGVRDSALEMSEIIKPLKEKAGDTGPQASNGQLLRLLTVLSAVAPVLSFQARVYLMHVLLKMGIDQKLATGEVQRQRSMLIARLLEPLAEDDLDYLLRVVGQGLFDGVQNLALQVKVVEGIPDYTAALQHMKRRLALSYVLADEQIVGYQLEEPFDMWERLFAWFDLRLAEATAAKLDYKHLQACATLVDIGVGGGFPVLHGTGGPVPQSVVPESKSTSASDKQVRDPTAEQFNGYVDRLSQQVYLLFARITDQGTDNEDRTHAKDNLEVLRYRLDHAVRTRPRRIVNVAREAYVKRGLQADASSVAMMHKWIAKPPTPRITVEAAPDN